MVPLRLGDDWRSIPRTLSVHGLYRNNVRTTLCTGGIVVLPHSATELDVTESDSGGGNIQDTHLRRMDICHFDG